MDDDDRWFQTVMRQIEERIIEGASDHSFPPILDVLRGNLLVASIACSDPSFLVFGLSRPAVAGFCATELVLLTDSYVSQCTTNPEGIPWSEGEMQRRAHEPEVAAVLHEAVSIHRVLRGGPATFRSIGYRVSNGRVKWEEPLEGQPLGVFSRTLREASDQVHLLDPETLNVGVRPEPGFSLEQIRLDCDLATVRAIYALASQARCSVGVGLAVPKDLWSQRRALSSFVRDGFNCEFL